MNTLIHNEKREISKNIVFVIFIGVWAIDNITKWAGDIALELIGQKKLFGVLFWGDLLSLNLIKIILTSILVGLSMVVYAYLSRDKRYYIYLLLGLLVGFFAPLAFLVIVFFISIFQNYQLNWKVLNLSGSESEFYITLLVIQAILIVVSSKLGQSIGLNLDYLDDKDKTKHTIYGIRKFYWFLISFPTNALLSVGIIATTRVLAVTINQIIQGKYSGGLEGLMSVIFFPIIAGSIILWIILKGLEIIRNNNLSNLKKLVIIIFLYIVIPTILLIFIGPR
ncbi:hypothetical protein HZC27_04680 [Candidatus Roizmanbacteria bacterium]|nr:hypothetical protein [Candidatus Roizmanbacteria bacterium]